MVDPLVSKLKALVRIKGGRSLEVFVDRESIGWGESWRNRLSESVENATIFIPLLSATYLDRSACREEFLAFHSKAEVLGVTELLLPILLFRSPLFTAESADEIVQIAEALQYKTIEDGLISGYDSAEWLRCTSGLSESLIAALVKAETALAARAETVLSDHVKTTTDATGDADNATDADSDVGLTELMSEMGEAIDQLNASAEGLSPAFDELVTATEAAGDMPDSPTPKQLQAWTFRLASAFKEPAVRIEQQGKQMFSAVKRLDEALLAMRQIADDLDMPEVTGPLNDGMSSLTANFGDLSEVSGTMAELLNSMKPAEVLSVPLRKSLQPARRGLTAVRDTLQLIESMQLRD